MGHSTTFLIPGFFSANGSVVSVKTLDAEIQKHMKVLRLRDGEALSILDGKGKIFDAQLQSQDTIKVLSYTTKAEPSQSLELALSFPKKNDLWEPISQATELGVQRILPIHSQHNQNPAPTREKMSEKAQKISDEACCQCRQPFRVQIAEEWLSLEESLQAQQVTHIFADESMASEAPQPTIENPVRLKDHPTIRLYIGPEGGWSDAERKLLKERALRMGLGSNVLRVPTAISVALYHLRYFSDC